MSAIEIIDALPEHAEYVAAHLREADIIELHASTPRAPAAAVRESYRWADWTKVVLVDGVPAVLYGVSPTTVYDVGSPWMLATDAIQKIQRYFIRGSRTEVERMKREYKMLFNRVHRDNTVSINWLRWLGFTVDTVPDGEFFQFWMKV